MHRLSIAILVIAAAPLLAQPGNIERGKIKSIDHAKMTLVITQPNKERQVIVVKETRLFGQENKAHADGIKAFQTGNEVFFLARMKDGVETLVGLKHADASAPPMEPVMRDTSKMKSLPDLAGDKYQGFEGGLYPGGKNERPADHEKAGLAATAKIRPLDAYGKPSDQGKIVLLSLGMSNTSQASEGFVRALSTEPNRNPALLFVNGAQGGMTAAAIRDPDDQKTGTRFWQTVDDRLKQAGVTRAQVQAIWIKEANAGPNEGFPKYAQNLQKDLTSIVQLLPSRFPNARAVYLSSRTYGGYATTRLNPEPYAFESGFSVQWLIGDQIAGKAELNHDPAKGAVKAPWLSWGPYLWVNGQNKRTDGYFVTPEDFAPDGTHHSPAGMTKLGQAMLRFFREDATTRGWFMK